MTSWILYALLIGLAIGVAALAAERIALAFHRQSRLLWVIALAATAGAPLVAFVQGWLGSASGDAAGRTTPLGAVLVSAWQVTAASPLTPIVQRVLLAAWIIASLVLLAHMATAWRRLRLTMRAWRADHVDGVPVFVSHNVGPAVLGVRRASIVLPEWALALDQPLRELVLRHEMEHRNARDPLALLGAALLCALFPWNLPLWWQAARLRLAIEMDCDARVLRSHPEVERYGLLLLAIAHQRSSSTPMLSAALSEPRSLLERRISAMSSLPTRHPIALTAFSALLIGGIAFACTAPSPNASTEPPANTANGNKGPTVVSEPLFEFQVEKPATPIMTRGVAPRYPDILRAAKVEGEVLVQFVVNRDGTADLGSFKVLKSDHDLFTNAVKQGLPNMRFKPAEVGGRSVRQLVQMPFQFNLRKD